MNKKPLFWDNLEDQRTIIDLLRQGKVLAGSSDTVLGLLAVASAACHQELDRMKGRSEKPYLILADSIDRVRQFSDAIDHPVIARLTTAFWPGPLTLILPAKQGIPSYLQGTQGGIAVRIPAHEALHSVMRQTGPLFSTSANLTGQPVPVEITQIDPGIMHAVAALVTDHTPPLPQPSTILDGTGLMAGGRLKLVREGAISRRELEAVLGTPLS